MDWKCFLQIWMLGLNCQSTVFWKGFDSLGPHGLQPTRLLSPWDFSGKNTWVACRSLFQGIFQTQGFNPSLSHCGQILYHLSHQQSPLRLNELLGWNTDSIGLVSSWSDTPENFQCLCVFSSISLPHPPPYVRTHGEASLGRKSSCQDLTMLAPWSETSRPQNCEERNFCWLFHWVYFILLWYSWLTNTESFTLEIDKNKWMKGNWKSYCTS